MSPLIDNPNTPLKSACFSQYPRVTPGKKPKGRSCITTGCAMGYTIVANVAGVPYRYTEWVDFKYPSLFSMRRFFP